MSITPQGEKQDCSNPSLIGPGSLVSGTLSGQSVSGYSNPRFFA